MRRVWLLTSALAWALWGAAFPSIAAEETEAVVTRREKGLVDWTQNYVEATGTAVAPKGMTGAQAKAMARRGAMLDLQRNLLEFLNGVQVDARTVMEDLMVNDTVRSELHGVIKNVETLSGEWDGEAYTIKGRVRIGQLRTVIAPVVSPKTRTKETPVKGKKARYTGLVIDVRHLPYVPAMTFQVLDQNGRAVYGMGFVNQNSYLQSGLCAYIANINYAKGEASVAPNPIVAKAVKLGQNNVDIVISNADASRVRSSSYNFRRECKVIVVCK